MTDVVLTGPQLCRVAGISYRQLDYWCRTDLLRPSLSEARGSGTSRAYSGDDARVALGLRKARDAGLSVQSLRRSIGYIRDPEGCDLLYVGANGTTGVCAADGEAITAAVRDTGGLLTIVDIASLGTEVAEALNAMASAPRPVYSGNVMRDRWKGAS